MSEPDGELRHDGTNVFDALKSKDLLVPAALSAAGAAAAAKAPDLLHRLRDGDESVREKLGRRVGGGAKRGFAGNALSQLKPGGKSGQKKTRRLPIQRWTDVAVPVAKAYEAWTDFEQFPSFMHRVLTARKRGTDKVRFQEKIWFSRREWEGEITDRRKNDRIAWKTTKGMSHRGVVSFHPLSDHLTRVMVTMELEPQGTIEKLASGLRFVKRAVQSDLARFKAYVELEDAKGIEYRPTGSSNRTAARQVRRRGRQGRRTGSRTS